MFRDCCWHLFLRNHSGILIFGRRHAEKVIGTYKQDLYFHLWRNFTWKYICSYGVWATEFDFVKSVIFSILSNYNQKLQERLVVYFNKSGAFKRFQKVFLWQQYSRTATLAPMFSKHGCSVLKRTLPMKPD